MASYKRIVYMCKECGIEKDTSPLIGRPKPGICPKRNGKAHSWVIKRKY